MGAKNSSSSSATKSIPPIHAAGHLPPLQTRWNCLAARPHSSLSRNLRFYSRQARSKSYHVSPTTETALTAIFMVDLSASALFVEPLSETVGRNPIYLASTAVMIAFTLEAALAPIYGTQLAFRFLSGVASSPSLSIYGGTLADLFDYKARRAVWPVFSISPLLGPVLAPVAGGWMSISSVDWQLYDSCLSPIRV